MWRSIPDECNASIICAGVCECRSVSSRTASCAPSTEQCARSFPSGSSKVTDRPISAHKLFARSARLALRTAARVNARWICSERSMIRYGRAMTARCSSSMICANGISHGISISGKPARSASSRASPEKCSTYCGTPRPTAATPAAARPEICMRSVRASFGQPKPVISSMNPGRTHRTGSGMSTTCDQRTSRSRPSVPATTCAPASEGSASTSRTCICLSAHPKKSKEFVLYAPRAGSRKAVTLGSSPLLFMPKGIAAVQLASARAALLMNRRETHVARGVGHAHPVFIERAHGARVWDVDGREYLDFAGGIGVQNIGHTHPKVVAAVREQAERLMHTCFQVALYEPYVQLAESLNRIAPGSSRKKTLLLTTGAEATENAVKIAREYTRRPAVVAFQNGYHGRTLLALTMTGKNAPYKQHFGPFCSEIYHAPFPNEFRGWTTERALQALSDLFASEVSPDRVAAIIIEPVLGEGGFVPAPAPFLQELRRITERCGIVLICDEVQTGFGRTGKMFACEHAGIEPDLLAIAKSMGGGLPLSAVVGKAEIMDAPQPGGLGGTYAGNPLACVAALATLEIMDEAFLSRAQAVGERIWAALRALQSRY